MATKGPLRRVERRVTYEAAVLSGEQAGDYLECGHRVGPASDIYGNRYPDRRRCRHCRTEEDRTDA